MKRWVSNRKTRDAQVKTLSCVVIWRMVLVLAFESTSASTNQGQSTVQRGCFLGSSASSFARTYKAVVWIVDGDQLVRCSSTHLRPVSTEEQTLCSLRDGEARTFQQLVQELPKRNFVDLVGQPSPVEEDFEEPMDVTSSDNELHEDFVSGDEFASAPDDSGVQKIRRCHIKHGPLHHMQRHQELCHQNLQKHHSFPKLNRVHPRHVLLLRKHPLFHSHRHHKPQQYHRQLHPRTWNYLQSQCLSLEQ